MKSETIRIRIDSEILSKVRTLAEQETRPLAKQIEYQLKLSLNEPSEYEYYQDEIIAYLISVKNGSLDTFNTMNEATRLLKLIKEGE
jgi:hypothetical protein